MQLGQSFVISQKSPKTLQNAGDHFVSGLDSVSACQCCRACWWQSVKMCLRLEVHLGMEVSGTPPTPKLVHCQNVFQHALPTSAALFPDALLCHVAAKLYKRVCSVNICALLACSLHSAAVHHWRIDWPPAKRCLDNRPQLLTDSLKAELNNEASQSSFSASCLVVPSTVGLLRRSRCIQWHLALRGVQ